MTGAISWLFAVWALVVRCDVGGGHYDGGRDENIAPKN